MLAHKTYSVLLYSCKLLIVCIYIFYLPSCYRWPMAVESVSRVFGCYNVAKDIFAYVSALVCPYICMLGC